MRMAMGAKVLRWITDCFMIYCIICVGIVKSQESPRAVLLYSSDSTVDNFISIQLDSITLNKIIADSEALGKIVKKINIRDVNGFTKLIRGESSKFSFVDDEKSQACDASCSVTCRNLVKTTTSAPSIFLQKKDTVTGPPYLPPLINKKDEGIYLKKTTFKPQTTQRKVFTPSVSQQKLTSTTQRPVPSTVKTTTSTQRPTTFSERQTTTRNFISSTQRPSTLSQRPTTSPQRPTTYTQRQTTTQRSIPLRPRSSTPGPAYLPVSKKSTPKRATVTERSYPPATWPSTTRHSTQTFPTWSAPIRQSTISHTVPTIPAKYLYKEPSNALSYGD